MTRPQPDPSFALDASRLNYLVHVSETRGLVYVEIPKAGCTTIKRILQLAELDGERTMLPRDVHSRKTSPLRSPRDLGERFEEIWHGHDTHRFLFVRNPFTRVLSCYLDKIVENQWERERRMPILGLDPAEDVDLLTFLRRVAWQPQQEYDIHWAPQTLLTGLPYNRYDAVYHFEHFADETRRLLAATGLERFDDEVSIKSHPTGAAERLEQFIGPDEADLIRRIYADDFVHLGYSPSLDEALSPPRADAVVGRERAPHWTAA